MAQQPQRHLITPIDALCVIERLYRAVPNATKNHVAFALGISAGHLLKEIQHLSAVINGNPAACARYNTRRSFMRQLYLWDNATDITLKFIMSDAMKYGELGNIASTRGKKAESALIIGVTDNELEGMQSEVKYLEELQGKVHTQPLKLLITQHKGNEVVEESWTDDEDEDEDEPTGGLNFIANPTNDPLLKDPKYQAFCRRRKIQRNAAQSLEDYRKYKADLRLCLRQIPDAKIVNKS